MNSENEFEGLGAEFRKRLVIVIGEEKPFPWAARIGIPSGTFDRIWNGGSVPKGEHLLKIHQETGVSIDWLLTGKGPMRIDESPSAPAAPPPQESPESAAMLKLWKIVAGAALEALRKEWLLRDTTPESFVEVVDALVELQIDEIGGLPPDIDNWRPDIKKYRRLINAAGRT